MSSAIGGAYGAMGGMQRPDPSQMASKLFSRLDIKNQGYIEKSDLQSAFARIPGAGNSDSSASIDDVFKQFDGDSDGRITKDEMSSGFKKLADELDSQFSQMRMNGFGGPAGMRGMGGMPPPPPQGGQQGDDAGFTKDELSSRLDEIGSSGSQRASLISNIVNNFDKADSDGDGKVSRQEAMAYQKSSSGDSSGSGAAADAGSSASESGEAKVMRKIMQLMHAYGHSGQDAGQSNLSSLMSVAA